MTLHTHKLRRNSLIVTLGALALAASSAATAQVRLFLPPNTATSSQAPASQTLDTQANGAQNNAQRTFAIDSAAMSSMQAGDAAIVTTPDGQDEVIIFDRTEIGYGGGKVWVGHSRDLGLGHPVIVSTFNGAVSGSVELNGRMLLLRGDEQHVVVTDTLVAGMRQFWPFLDDTATMPRNPLSGMPLLSTDSATISAASPGSPSQINLLFLFSPNLQAQLGGYPSTIARANQLVTLANMIYTNSGIGISLNIVYAQEITTINGISSDTAQDSDALPALAADATVQTMRNLYGADLVTLARPFIANVCGLAYIPGGFTSGNASSGFSVFEDGQQPAPGGGFFYCDPSSMTHELGHNMGAAHDAYAAETLGGTVNGTPSYNRGYCNGNAATIMSYVEASSTGSGCNTLVPYFSNPALTTSCSGGSCGVLSTTTFTAPGTSTPVTGADSTTAININAPSIASWRTGVTKYTALPSARLVDTRSGQPTTDGMYTGTGALSPGGQIDFWAVGRGGMPMTNVGSIVMTVTATAPTGNGFFTVWPSNTTRPNASNLNFAPGQTISNLVIAKPGSTGYVSIFNSKAGSTQVIVDVGGWFPSASGFSVLTPARLLDTRGGSTTTDGQFQAIGTRADKTETDLTVLGRGGIPASGVKAVALNVTATGAAGAGFVTAWPAGATRPTASNLNYDTGITIPNIVITGVGTGAQAGKVALYNSVRTELVADVAGWFSSTSELNLIGPSRLIDTRAGSTTVDGQFQGAGALTAGGHVDLTVVNRGGIPASGVGTVVLNVTAVTPTATGFLTVWPTGATRPNAPNVSFSSGQIIPNLVFAQVSSSGQVSIYNSAGSTQVVADVVGWLPASP